MERAAFRRIWHNFTPFLKWYALAAAVATGILYVAFLLVLGLFADLMIHRGKIPAYRDLLSYERNRFRIAWATQVSQDEERQWLRDLGMPNTVNLDPLVGKDPTTLAWREQGLVWRAQVFHVLSERVNSEAATVVLPEYRDLPDSVQEAFRAQWNELNADQRKEMLGPVPKKADELTAKPAAELTSSDWDLLWRCHLYQHMKVISPEGADYFLRDRHFDSVEYRREQELADRGILSLVVRNQHNLLGSLAGWSARWSPWMWQYGSTERPNYYYFLSGLLVIALVLTFLRALAMFIMNYMASVAAIEASNRLRRAVYHHTYRLGRLAFRSLGPSEAVGIFTKQLETMHTGLYLWMTVIFREPVKFVLLVVLALAVNFWLALAFLFFVILVWLVGGQLLVFFRRQERQAAQVAADQLALLQESLMMMRLVKVYLMELFNQSRVERQLAKYADAQMRHYRGEAIYRPLLLFLATIAIVVLSYVGGTILLSGRLGMAGAIVLTAALVSLYLPVQNFIEYRRIVARARESSVVLFKFLDRPGEVGQAVGAEFLPPLAKTLEFDGVSLKEPGTGRKLLQGVSLKIKAGKRVALIGTEEMEKHALVYLIPRFLDPDGGEIRIDDHDLKWVTIDSLRAQIAMVLQHNLVFNDTVANNIGCGDATFTLPKIIEAAKMAHAHQFIQRLPKGYETMIGEMGQSLNTSQQFRIALARAILRDPAVLIIEEPRMSLDDETSDLIDDTFDRVLPGRTVIFLPHRLSTIRSCDHVFLLNQGRIEAEGPHRDLLGQNHLYKHLHYLEFNEFADQV